MLWHRWVSTQDYKSSSRGQAAPPSLGLMSSALDTPLSCRCSKAADRSASRSPLIQTPAVDRDKRECLTAWSAWTTVPTATWPGRWSASWTVWTTGHGWTRASVAPLRLTPELSAPSTIPNPCSRAPWTASTNWTHSRHSQRCRHPLTKAWWRNGEAAARLSKVGTHVAELTTLYCCSVDSGRSLNSVDVGKTLTKTLISQ